MCTRQTGIIVEMTNQEKPLVSVKTITYNHAAYIGQCIEGVLMQKTTFPFELIIGEDCSTDGTRAIVLEYAQKYPEIIRVVTSDSNVGARNNARRAQSACRGLYMAYCEGDDYWTDPYKLQKQVDFLEAHPEYPGCFHPARWLEQKTGEMQKALFEPPIKQDDYTLDDLLEYTNFIPTASVVYRSQIVKEQPEWFYQSPIGDFLLHVLNLYTWGNERIGYIDEPMSVYREHGGGMYSSKPLTHQLRLSIQTYLLLGSKLDLAKRPAWHKGMSKIYVNLCREYQVEGAKIQALRAGYHAVQQMPRGSRNEITRQVFAILFPPVKGPFIPILAGLLLLQDEGLLALARAAFRKILKTMQIIR